MRKLTFILLAGCSAAILCPAQDRSNAARLQPTYELYSWLGTNSSWNFKLLFTTDRLKTPEEVFDDKTASRGIEALGKKISRLPRKSRIVWIDQITFAGKKIKGTENLRYPPNDVVEQVRRLAAKHNIEFDGP